MQKLRSQSHISVLSISFPPFSWIKQKHKKKPTLPRSCPEGGKCHLTSETSEKTSEIWDFTPKFFGNMKLRYKKIEALLKSHWNKKTQHFGQVTLSKYFLVRSLNDSHGFRAHKKNKSLGTLGEEASRDGFSRNHFGILQILFRILLVSDVPEEVAIQDNYTTSEKNPGCEKPRHHRRVFLYMTFFKIWGAYQPWSWPSFATNFLGKRANSTNRVQ